MKKATGIKASKGPPLCVVTNVDEHAYDTEDYRSTALEPSHVFVEDRQMDEDQWHHLAFSLGLPTKEYTTPSLEAIRFVQKIRRRARDENARIDDLIAGLLLPLCRAHRKIDYQVDALFSRDAVPQRATDQETRRRWTTQLPTPRPAFTFGYRNDAFRQSSLDLQRGIVNIENDQPCNLAGVSQPVREIYWPFLIIEIRTRAQVGSMLSAKHACAGAGATCNNAISILANAARRSTEHRTSLSLQWDTVRLTQSFSLAIDGLTACLSSHNSRGELPHCMTAVRSYRLYEESDVQALCSRLQNIMVWADNSRLPNILEVLDRLDRRVNSRVLSQTARTGELADDFWKERFGPSKDPGSPLVTRLCNRFPALSRVLRNKPAS